MLTTLLSWAWTPISQLFFALAGIVIILAIILIIIYHDREITLCLGLIVVLFLFLGVLFGVGEETTPMANERPKIVLNEDNVHVVCDDADPYIIIDSRITCD